MAGRWHKTNEMAQKSLHDAIGNGFLCEKMMQKRATTKRSCQNNRGKQNCIVPLLPSSFAGNSCQTNILQINSVTSTIPTTLCQTKTTPYKPTSTSQLCTNTPFQPKPKKTTLKKQARQDQLGTRKPHKDHSGKRNSEKPLCTNSPMPTKRTSGLVRRIRQGKKGKRPLAKEIWQGEAWEERRYR